MFIKTVAYFMAWLIVSLSGVFNIETDQYIDVVDVTEYQTFESFGTSTCWWAQTIDDEELARDIAKALFSDEEGLGLDVVRYNVGGGEADNPDTRIWDTTRRTESFYVYDEEKGEYVYDFTRDANARRFLDYAIEYGAKEVILFCNSPHFSMTASGHASGGLVENASNLPEENYDDFVDYLLTIADWFVEEGYPVTYISPINEPQWSWGGEWVGQEGCHYEPSEIAGVYLAFLEEMKKRPTLSGVELSGPESGEWGGQTPQYVSALLDNEKLRAHFTAVDCHSYWSNTQSKASFRNFMDVLYPDVKIRMSEWCEMVNGTDLTMDSAIHLAQCVQEDLTVLDAVSWCTWVGVSPGGYRDGLIHAAENGTGEKSIVPLKRLWAYGNYTRFIRPGFVRVDTQGAKDAQAVAFKGERDGKQQLVIVLINEDYRPQTVKLTGDFFAYTTT